jgi:ribosome biogenesis GTPase
MLGLDHDFNVRRLERYLAAVWESGAMPVVLLNKADVCKDVDRRLEEVRDAAICVDVHVLSALTAQGIETIDAYLNAGVTAGVVGSSGVGKSTLLNRLLGRDVQATKDVREHDSRGRHTTTHRELFALPGGAFVIDTPGMREFQLAVNDVDGPAAGVESVFSDIEALAEQCRFSDCSHQSEPGCAVREHADPDRLAAYEKLLRERLTAAERKREGRLGAKAIRQMKRVRGR